jgi:site-specific recombinase XerD
MVELLFTTDVFRPEGCSVPGVPMLLDGNMRLVEPACGWLMHIALVRGRTRSPQTWRTYGEALYDWWQTLEVNGWAWDRVSYYEVAAYRDRMLTGPSGHTGRPHSRATINLRLRVVALFYHWCAARGLVEATPFTIQEVSVARWRPAPFLAHVDASGGVRSTNELVLREVATLPRPLAPEAMRRIVTSLGARDRLIVEWAAMTGMRRMEVAGLPKTALPETEATEFVSKPMVPIRLDVTKGSRVRVICAPLPWWTAPTRTRRRSGRPPCTGHAVVR